MTSENNMFFDCESQNSVDLVAAGLGRYLASLDARVYCFTFRLPGMQSTDLWTLYQPVPKQIVTHLERGGLFVAHNAAFDSNMWNQVMRRTLPHLPFIRPEQIRCSAVRARYNGLPSSLEKACEALGLPIQKDKEGGAAMKQVMRDLAKTEKTDPELFARIYKYGITDTDAMIGLWQATKPITVQLQREYELDLAINARGLGVDVEAAQAMEDLKELAEARLDYEITLLSQGGILAVTEVEKIKKFIAQDDEEFDDLSRETVKKLVARADLPEEVRSTLSLRLDASRAPKKSAAILKAHVDGRIQHSTLFYGALSGRSTARGAANIQLLNVARPRPGRKPEQCEAYLEAARRKDVAMLSSPENGPLLSALADAQRSLFRAIKPDHVIVGADLSGIEARMSAWLANDTEKLNDYENKVDSYIKSAMKIYDLPYESIDKEQRQIGKVADLALGFGGKRGALQNMADAYGVALTPEQADDIVYAWCAGRPAYERWWAVLEYAALIALDQPGRIVAVPSGRDWCAKIEFVRDDRALRMILPNGRVISYHNARLHLEPGASTVKAIYDKPAGFIETLDRKILSNNGTQGLARCGFWEIMCDVSQWDARHGDIVHHVYDELLMETPKQHAEETLNKLLERMRAASKWAPGLPLNAAGYISLQWRKD